ncbi:MAG: 2-hydroxyacid dehydrogenase [Fuerstiella sp.]
MKVAFFSAKPYDETTFNEANDQTGHDQAGHEIDFLETRLNPATASLARGYPAICVFVNDVVSREVLAELSEHGLKVVALRCAGFNNVDLEAAAELGIAVVRVPAYSPHAVAEHTLALLLALNRRIHKAYGRVREGNFALQGLLGFDLHGKTVGVVGTGKIGEVVVQILRGFGCRVLLFDVQQNERCTELGANYESMDRLLAESDVVTLHCPLTPDTKHLINETTLQQMKTGAYLINTSRGGIVCTDAVIRALKSGHLGGLAIDVYEEEADLFFEDLSSEVIRDDVFARLLTFPNVLITGHQAFFTQEAMQQIAQTTLSNISAIERDEMCENAVTADAVRGK